MDKHKTIINPIVIKDKIHTIRRQQVMLDEDLAFLYGVSTKRLNEQVKRNKDRFPEDFCFKINREESNILRSQFATLNKKVGRKYLPYAFTEQGVAMLSAVLRSPTAVKVSISIMSAFVSLRKIISENKEIYYRLDVVERKQILTDQKIEKILRAYNHQAAIPSEKIFFEGEVFDAHELISRIIRSAKKSISIIDNYLNESILSLCTKRQKDVVVTLYTNHTSPDFQLDIDKFNAQYDPVKIIQFDKSHDRFIIIDNTEVYHLGASLKDLGKKWFVVTKLDISALKLLGKL